MVKFYTYYQNNSGGGFITNNDVKEYVIIEAHSSEQANDIAENIGIYFDGMLSGEDCSCCGSRWNEQYADNGDPEPMVFDTPVHEAEGGLFTKECIIHYLNGAKEVVKLK